MEVLINGSQIGVQTNLESEQYDIDNSSGQLFSVLSELYSRPVDSCIREICTNCNDAHIMSKKEEKPFIIVLPNPDKKLFNLSIRDFGPGLNEVTISKIFTYGGSSKRDDIDSTGCLGLGAKSPYAITDTFYVKSFCDGKLTHYICFKDENNRPNKSKDPVELDTLEENGLEIIIPIWDKYDYISILKRELKYFKVKPLVYIDEGNGEKSPVNIDWENDIRIQFTENVYVLPEVIHSPILFFKDEINKNPLVEQLQIWYPLESSVILTAIERYNLKKMYSDGSINEKYKISETRKIIIKLLLNSGVKIKAVNQVMFSPSRESIKYTERTLEYIISNLNRAAKLIEKNIISKINSIKNLDDYFDNCVLKNSLYNLILDKFSWKDSPKIAKFEKELAISENLYGIVNIKNQNHCNNKFNKDVMLDIYNNGMSCYNIGYSEFDPNSSGIIFEWQTQEYQIENLKIIKDLLLEFYKNIIINHINVLKKDIEETGVEEVCSKRDIKLTNLVREKVSIFQYIKTLEILNEYKLIKKFIKSPSSENFVKSFNKNVFYGDYREELSLLQHIILGYEYLKVGKIYPHFPMNTIGVYYKTLQKLYPKINKNGLPKFNMLKFIKNLRDPKIISRTFMPFEIEENYLTTLFKSCKNNFTYTKKTSNFHSNRTIYMAYFLSYYSMLRNPHIKKQLELQNMDLKEYNDLIINQLSLPKKVKHRINTKNYFVIKNKKTITRNVPKLETPWILIDADERKFKSIIKQLNYKIEFLQNIYERITLEELSLNLNFSTLYKKNQKLKFDINLDDYKNIFLSDTSEIPEEILVNEYVKYISKLLNYYFTLYYATLKIKDTLNINRTVYINKDSVIINDKLKALSVTHDKKLYYSYSNFIELNRALYTIIKPEKIIVNNIEIDVVNVDLNESLFEDIKYNYINELTSVNILNSYQRFPKITDGAGIATLNIFHKEYGYTLGKHLITLAKMEMPQKFGKLYLEYESQITKEELLKNFEYVNSKFNLVTYKNTKSVATNGRFLNFVENEESIFGIYPKNKLIDNNILNTLVDKFKNSSFIKKENYLFLPNGSPEYNKILPKKVIIDKLEVLFKHFHDIHKIIRTKKFFYADKDTIESFVFILKSKYSSSSNSDSMFKIFLSNGDNGGNEFNSKLYSKLQEQSVFLHFYNIYKFIHSKESDFNFDDLIKTYAEASSGSWAPQVNEFYPKIKTELFNKLKKLSNIYWNTFNKLDSNVMKEFVSVIKSFDEAVKNKDVDGAIKSIADKDMFSKIGSLRYTLMDIFEIYSQEVFTKNFEFLQILKSENIDILFSDSSLLDQKTKNAIEKTFNNLNSSKTSYTEFMEVERIILKMQNRIVNVVKGTNEIILTLSRTLHLENFKSLLDFSPIMNENKTPLLKFIKLFLNKHVNLSDRIKRKIFNKHNIILSDIPNYFINKWSYLNLTDKEFKRYVMNQKINRKLKGK